uniref:Ig-like domain-containing protein n=1 Tax=Nothobranchius furzeri TaxID=105023 RepID=A0A8C6PVM4_NOTFU
GRSTSDVSFRGDVTSLFMLLPTESTSKVTSSNTKPVANLGEDELLSCFVSSQSQQTRLGDVSVTWEKKDLGLVYQYSNGAPALAGQASQFTGRAQVFPVAVATGNASLLLRNVRGGDEGEYTCSVSSSAARGSIIIQLRTAAFSAPTFKFSNGTLTGEASRWFPKPSVTWLNQTGDILSANTSFTENSEGIVGVVSVFESAQVSETYSCRIQNSLVLAETETRQDHRLNVQLFVRVTCCYLINFSQNTRTYLEVWSAATCQARWNANATSTSGLMPTYVRLNE